MRNCLKATSRCDYKGCIYEEYSLALASALDKACNQDELDSKLLLITLIVIFLFTCLFIPSFKHLVAYICLFAVKLKSNWNWNFYSCVYQLHRVSCITEMPFAFLLIMLELVLELFRIVSSTAYFTLNESTLSFGLLGTAQLVPIRTLKLCDVEQGWYLAVRPYWDLV